MYPHPLRYIARYFISALKVVRAQHIMAENILTPIIKERNQGEKCEGYEKPKDTIEWVRDAMPLHEKDDYHFQSLCQLGITAAAIHTTSQSVTFALYDLASYPEYVSMLREEAVEVRNRFGGEFTLESMGELKKLDSFIKESQRMNPIIVTTVVRKILKPLTLSDGTYLPRNTITMAATEALSGDPTYYKEPEKFDGLRFYNLRQRSAEDEKRSQFVSTSQTHLHFGSGRHACPGRWFASHEMKLIIIAFIERYDLKLKKIEGRPKNMRYQHINAPDPNGEILLKSRGL
jgi:cytochrome P450